VTAAHPAPLERVMATLPPGYVAIGSAREARVAGGVVLASLAPALRDVLATGALYDSAAAHPARRTLHGRGPVYAVPLGGVSVVVRRVRHGGWLAPVTRDLFVPPTRAPHELAVALRLRAAGVPTPEVVAYVLYRAAGCFRRVDVATREIPGGADLGARLAHSPTAPDRAAAWAATDELLAALARAGAQHPDLNVKNVLIAGRPDGALAAYALDVDRVRWRPPGDPAVLRANRARLERSARKRGLL